ncbi:Oidioi.mRNA.OKI2018_I69.PAR.g8980.t1.cds [Oikopleura dioica]|uniref:Oidioi.mRNA.OKI2018_I69.PAR.g8980.t1.cds n=1 Tax=Oikopleura dioica TaxID=34765 RepID=A0ABN7RLX3_OIKDI|nr:Oidioi.mRNA.OKI2018_I69.PAR.g8980.t1.cds [Oikopleura dioica]
MKLLGLFFGALSAQLVDVYFDDQGQQSEDGKTWRALDVDEKGPGMCKGQKIPAVENGKWKCQRNLNDDGTKKGKGRKCKLQCNKGFQQFSDKQNRPWSDGVVKCKSNKGWKRKPGKISCVKK